VLADERVHLKRGERLRRGQGGADDGGQRRAVRLKVEWGARVSGHAGILADGQNAIRARAAASAGGFHDLNGNAEPLHRVGANIPCERKLGGIRRGKIGRDVVQEVDVGVWNEYGIHERLSGSIDERGEIDFLI